QSDARLQRYSESINLATFGFELPGQPPVIGPFNVYDAQLTASMQLFNLAALRYYQASRAGVEASKWRLQQAQNDVTVSVARLYVTVQRADAQVVSRDASVKLFEQLARVAKDEFDAGTGTRLDVAQANVQLARAREALLRAQNDRESARIALLGAIGADQSSDVVLAPLTTPETTLAIDSALATAREQRPELKGAQAAEKAAELTLRSASARAARSGAGAIRHRHHRIEGAAVTAAPPVNKWLVTISVTFGTLMGAIDVSIVNVAVPHLAGALGATIEQITWVTTGFVMAT